MTPRVSIDASGNGAPRIVLTDAKGHELARMTPLSAAWLGDELHRVCRVLAQAKHTNNEGKASK